MPHNWGMISDGATFESLVQSLLFFEKPGTILFGRPGQDAGQDARSADGQIVYQAKFHKACSMNDAIKDAEAELEKINRYRANTHNNYKYWKSVDTWVLVSNFSINPTDQKKWEEKIIPSFRGIGLKAEYWTQDDLENMLTQHADVADNYFSGQNRNFLSLNEAYRSVTSENFGEIMFSVDEIGREAEIKKVKAFLENDLQNILPIVGFGGVGKTRFLYERGVEYSNAGWRVFWANTETMTDSSDWFKGLSSEDKVLVLANEPESAKFIQKCLEQLDAFSRHNWKIIIAVRSARDLIIKFIHDVNAKSPRIASDIDLNPLSEELRKELVKSLLKEVAITLDETRIEQLVNICEGYPIWIGLAVQLLRDHGSTHNLPNSAKELVDGYLHEIKENHDGSICEIKQLSTVLNWVALFKTCNVENSNLIEFVSNQSSLSIEKIATLLNDLTKRRVLKNWGVNKRLYAVKPDVIRDHILRGWLIDECSDIPKPSQGAKDLVKLLLKEESPMPNLDNVLTQIARTEYMNLDGGTRILTPIFEGLQSLASNPSVHKQQKVVRRVSRVGFSSPEDAIDTLGIIVNTVTKPETLTDELWGKFEVTHKQIVDDIPQVLHDLVIFIEKNDEASKLFKLLRKIYLNRYTPKEDWDYIRLPEENVIQQLIKRFRMPDVLTDVIISSCNEYIEKLNGQDLLNDADLTFAKLVFSTFLDVERESTYSVGMTTHFTRHIIGLDSPFGKEIIRIRNSLKKVVRVSPIIPHRRLVWNIISLTNSAMNRRVGTKIKSEEMQPWQKRMRTEYEDDLVWCLQIIKEQKEDMSMAEWAAARELWEWDFRYSGREESKKVAERCEALYKAAPVISEFKLSELFDRSKSPKEEQNICREIADNLLGKDKDTLVRFIGAIDLYVATKKGTSITKSYGIAHLLGDNLEGNPFVSEYVEGVLPEENPPELLFHFAVEIIRAEILGIRAINQQQAINRLKYYTDLAFDKILFVSRYYSNPHPHNIGMLTIEDVEFFKDLNMAFDPSHQYEKFFDVAGVLYFWDSSFFMDLLGNWWTALSTDIDKKCIAMRTFIKSLWLTWLRYEDHTELIIPDDLLAKIIDLAAELPSADLMFHTDLATLGERTHLQLTMQQFNTLLKKRIALSKNQEVASLPDFEAMPFQFDVKTWVKFDPASDEGKMHQLIELSQEPVTYQDIPQYAVELDVDSKVVPDYIKSKLDMLLANLPDNTSDITQWSRFAGYYSNDTEGWKTIAVPACKLASELLKKERTRVFCSLNPSSTEARSHPVGSVDPYYQHEVDKAIELHDKENEDALKSYREWMVEASINELEYAKGRAEEDLDNE